MQVPTFLLQQHTHHDKYDLWYLTDDFNRLDKLLQTLFEHATF